MTEKLVYDSYSIYSNVVEKLPFEVFWHKHMDNPNIVRDLAILVNYQSGDPAGTITYLGAKLHVGNEREITTLLSSDSAVLEKYRRRHIYTSLMLQAINDSERYGVSLIFGFPNQMSYSGCKKMGFQDIGLLWTCAAILRPFAFLMEVFFHKASRCIPFEDKQLIVENECTWAMSSICPFSENDLDIINSRPGIHFHRDFATFQWKIDSKTEETAYIYARKGQQLYAYFVIGKNKYGICDLLDYFFPEDKKSANYCINRFMKSIRKYCNALVARTVNSDNATGNQIWRKLFIRKQNTHLIVYPIPGQINDTEKERLLNFSEWAFTYFDSDVILND